MRRRLTGTLLACTAAAVAAALLAPHVLAQPGPRGMRRGFDGAPGMSMGFVLRELDLTDTQRDQIRTIFEQHEADLRAAADQLRTARQAQEAAIVAVPLDEAQVLARADEVGRAQADLALLQARLHQDVYQVLTAEQQARAAELRAERDARRQERRERMLHRMEERRERQQQEVVP